MQALGHDILILAAHPDDEVLGCGGTIAKHTENGDRVHIVILAEGITSRTSSTSDDVKNACANLHSCAHDAASILGIDSLELLGLPDNRLDTLCQLDLVQLIEERISAISPHTVYVHHSGDVNIDHRRIHEACITACRPLVSNSVKQLLGFEVASSTEWQTPGSQPFFNPNYFVDITNQWPKKLQALRCYASEMREFPHSRSYEALECLAKWRGAQSGLRYAESFVLLRQIV